MEWVIKDDLARSTRPGFPSHDVPPEHVEEWLEQINGLGIQSVIVLLHTTQLTWYPQLEEGLLDKYRDAGLDVTHFNILDYKTPPIEVHDLPPIFEAYQQAQKPVLIHCSAGVDRTGQAVEFILGQLGEG